MNENVNRSNGESAKWLNAYDPVTRYRAELIDLLSTYYDPGSYLGVAKVVDEFLESSKLGEHLMGLRNPARD